MSYFLIYPGEKEMIQHLGLSLLFRGWEKYKNILASFLSLILFLTIGGTIFAQNDLSQTEKVILGLGPVNAVVYSPDGNHIATAGQVGAILWNVESGEPVPTQWFEGHKGEVFSVAISPDGTQVLTGSMDLTAKLWDANTGEETQTFTGHSAWIKSVAFSPDGKKILTGSLDNSARLWNVTEGDEAELVFRVRISDVISVAFSPKGKEILTGSSNQIAQSWDVETGARNVTFEGHSGGIRSVAYSPNGRQVLTGSTDHTAKLWNAGDGKEIYTISQQDDTVRSVAFSPDGSMFLTGSDDRTAKLWETESGELIRTFEGHTEPILSVAFSPDGLNVVTGSADGTARIRDISDLFPPPPQSVVIGGGELGAEPGSKVTIPLRVSNLPSTNAIGFDVSFDFENLGWEDKVLVSNGMMASWGLVDAHEIIPGRLRFSAAALSAQNIRGDGTLAYLAFIVNEDSQVAITTIINFDILVDGAEGAEILPIAFSIGFKGDLDGNGRITANDVQIAFEITLYRTQPTTYQRWSAETNFDGRITASDVQAIFNASLGIGSLSQAKILKENRPLGTTSLTVGNVLGNPQDEVILPLYIVPGSELTALSIDLLYDYSKLRFLGTDKEGTLMQQFGVADAYESSPGVIRFSAAALSAAPISDSGVLIYLRFQIKNEATGSAVVAVTSTNDDLLNALTSDGMIQTNTAVDWRIH